MSKLRHIITAIVLAALVANAASCGHKGSDKAAAGTHTVAPREEPVPAKGFQPTGKERVYNVPTHIVPGPLRQIFNDSNALQLQAAQQNGIDPITDYRSAYRLKRPVVRVKTTRYYWVDSLYFSLPYLVPKAANLLGEIAKAFNDTLAARGGHPCRLKVTSLLRTSQSVGRLRHYNRNASSQSCHQYGTTFDISWTKFDYLDPNYIMSLEDMKNILGEIIYDFRARGKCYAIFEAKQGCFHVTVR